MQILRFLLPIVLITACSSAGDAGAGQMTAWVGTDDSTAVLIRWTETPDGSVEGVIQIARLASEAVDSETLTITGVRSGTAITVTVDQGLGFSMTIIGEIDGDTLTTFWPGTDGRLEQLILTRSTVADYNIAVDALAATAAGISVTNRETAERAAALDAADRQLVSARTRLQDAITAASDALTWATYAADQVASDLEVLKSDVTQLEATVANEPEYASYDLDAVEFTWEGLQSDLDYALGPETVGLINDRLDEVPQAVADLRSAMREVRQAEDRYLSDEFAPYDFTQEENLIAEAETFHNSGGPQELSVYLARLDSLDAEGRRLAEYARSLANS